MITTCRGESMKLPEKTVDYDLVRSSVKAAFSYNDAPSDSWPLADYITSETKEITKPQIRVPEPPSGLNADQRKAWRRQWRENYKNTRWNQSVRGTATRNSGRSKIPIGSIDFGGCRMRDKIRRLEQGAQHVLHYFYNHNTIVDKRYVKNLIWRIYEPTIPAKSPADTRALISVILDALLPCYRDKMIKGKDYPANPATMFRQITGPMWKRTYRDHWNGLEETIIELDESILELVR